jgi:hypothetical protein
MNVLLNVGILAFVVFVVHAHLWSDRQICVVLDTPQKALLELPMEYLSQLSLRMLSLSAAHH